MRLIAITCLLALSLVACRKAEPPAPSRPPGEVYSAPEGQYLFIKPPTWRTLVLPESVPPGIPGATSEVRWNLNVESERPRSLLTLVTFPPEAWAAYTPDSGAVEVVFQDDRRVIAAMPADPNPYEPGSEGAGRFDALRLPLDTVRARLIVR